MGTGLRAFARRHRGLLIFVGALAAFCVLQVPPFDQWRFHTILEWRFHPASAKPDSWAASPNEFRIPKDVPMRLKWESDSSLPSADAMLPPLVASAAQESGHDPGRCRYFDGQWTLVAMDLGFCRLVHDYSIYAWHHMWWPDYHLSPGSSQGRVLFIPVKSERTYGAYRLYARDFGSSPPVRFTVSQPYGYLFYLPIEDYLLVAAGVSWVVWRVIRRRRSRSPAAGPGGATLSGEPNGVA